MGAVLRASRPRQWTKNILVLAAPAAAGIAFQPRAALEMGVAVVAFILASSGVYLVNDTIDVEADQAHPTKRLRPVAGGELSAREALTAAAVLLSGGLVLSALLTWQLLVVVALYEAIQLLYCLGMKREPVIELVGVASGFLLRAIAGGVATHIDLSPWFLVAAEKLLAGDTTAAIRSVLASYTASYLRFVWTVSAGVLVTTYALWASTVHQAVSNSWSIVSILPFVVVLLRYALKIDAGDAGEPEEAVLHDRVLLLLLAIWAACFMGSVYL